MNEIILLSVALVGVGAYNWWITDQYHAMKTQCENYLDMVMSMAEELQELGSPNVKVVKNED